MEEKQIDISLYNELQEKLEEKKNEKEVINIFMLNGNGCISCLWL